MAKKVEKPTEPLQAQTFTITYDTDGRVLSSASTVPDTVAALKMFKAMLEAIIRQTDALLLAAVEREVLSRE